VVFYDTDYIIEYGGYQGSKNCLLEGIANLVKKWGESQWDESSLIHRKS